MFENKGIMIKSIGLIFTILVFLSGIVLISDVRDYIPSEDIDNSLEYIHDFENANLNEEIGCWSIRNQSLLHNYSNTKAFDTDENEVDKEPIMNNFTYLENGSISNFRDFDVSNTSGYDCIGILETILIGNCSNPLTFQFSMKNGKSGKAISFTCYDYDNLTLEDIDTIKDEYGNEFDQLGWFYSNFYSDRGNQFMQYGSTMNYTIVQYSILNSTHVEVSLYNDTLDLQNSTIYETWGLIDGSKYLYLISVTTPYTIIDGNCSIIASDSTLNPSFYNFSCWDIVFQQNELYNTYQYSYVYSDTSFVQDFELNVISDNSNEYHMYQFEIDGNIYWNETQITELPFRDFTILVTSFSESSNFTLTFNVTIDYGFHSEIGSFMNSVTMPVLSVSLGILLVYIVINKIKSERMLEGII